MSAKSRGRHRFAQDSAEREAAAEEQDSKWAAMMDAFGAANTRAGLRKLVGMVMDDREEQLKPEEPAKVDPDGPRLRPDVPFVEPTQYQRAISVAVGKLPQVYGGTVEPWRVERRRRRNKAARATRRSQRKAAAR